MRRGSLKKSGQAMQRNEPQLPDQFVRVWKALLSAGHAPYSDIRQLVGSESVATSANYPLFAQIESWQWFLSPFRCVWLWILKQGLCRSQTLGAEHYGRLIVAAQRILDYLEFGRVRPPAAWRHYVRALNYQMDRKGESRSRVMFKWRIRHALLSHAVRRTEGASALRDQPFWVFQLCQVSLAGTLLGLTLLLVSGFASLLQAGELSETSLIRFYSAELLSVAIIVLYHFGYGWKWGYELLSELDFELIETPAD